MTQATLRFKKVNLDCGRHPIVFLHKDSDLVKKEGFTPLKQVKVFNSKKSIYAIVNLVDDSIITTKELTLSKEAIRLLNPDDDEKFSVKYMEPLTSFTAIRNKLRGQGFTEESTYNILKDVVDGRYTDMHMACLCSATEGELLSDNEIEYLAKAMIKTGDVIKWNYDIVVDKHCIGGLPGNRTTPPAIAIVAEYGLHIPKISSGAITSCSGTADTMSVLTNVNIPTKKIKKIVEKVGGCLVGNGNMELNPSDEIIVRVKRELNFDSRGQMLASILSKKIAAGSTHILIDIPYGPTAKSKSLKDAKNLKKDFETLGKKLGAHVYVNLSDGKQPVGNGIGPSLEAQDLVDVLQNKPNAPQDLKEKTIHLAGIILEFSPNVKKGQGAKIAREILESGRAWNRFKMICEAQGGLKTIKQAKFSVDVLASKSGIVSNFENKKLASLARLAGCPSQKEAGVYLYKHLQDKVTKGEKLYTIYANSQGQLDLAYRMATTEEIITIK